MYNKLTSNYRRTDQFKFVVMILQMKKERGPGGRRKKGREAAQVVVVGAVPEMFQEEDEVEVGAGVEVGEEVGGGVGAGVTAETGEKEAKGPDLARTEEGAEVEKTEDVRLLPDRGIK